MVTFSELIIYIPPVDDVVAGPLVIIHALLSTIGLSHCCTFVRLSIGTGNATAPIDDDILELFHRVVSGPVYVRRTVWTMRPDLYFSYLVVAVDACSTIVSIASSRCRVTIILPTFS